MTDRPRTVALYHLRTLQIGLRFFDLFYLTEGEIWNIVIEKNNDNAEYDVMATQDEIDNFGNI